MDRFFIIILVMILFSVTSEAQTTIYDIAVKTIAGERVSLNKYRGQVLLIANTASKCTFTPQYKDLQELYTRYASRGFTVLGFPSNDFLSQEPGTNEEIAAFCQEKYKITFPLFEKQSVSGSEIQPLYAFLTKASNGGEVLWNFEKFLIDRKGNVRGRYRSKTVPTDKEVVEAIENLLNEK